MPSKELNTKCHNVNTKRGNWQVRKKIRSNDLTLSFFFCFSSFFFYKKFSGNGSSKRKNLGSMRKPDLGERFSFVWGKLGGGGRRSWWVGGTKSARKSQAVERER